MAAQVIDLAGLRRSDLNAECRELLATSMRLGAHYPGRTARLIFINKPLWASILLVIVRAHQNADSRKKVTTAESLNGGIVFPLRLTYTFIVLLFLDGEFFSQKHAGGALQVH